MSSLKLKDYMTAELPAARAELAAALAKARTGSLTWSSRKFPGSTGEILLKELVAGGWSYESTHDGRGGYNYEISPNNNVVRRMVFAEGEPGSENPLPSVRGVLSETLPSVRAEVAKVLNNARTASCEIAASKFTGVAAAVLLPELNRAGWDTEWTSDHSGGRYTVAPNYSQVRRLDIAPGEGESALPSVESVLREATADVRAVVAKALRESNTVPCQLAYSKFIGSTYVVISKELAALGWTSEVSSGYNPVVTITPDYNRLSRLDLTPEAIEERLPAVAMILSEALGSIRARVAGALRESESGPCKLPGDMFPGSTFQALLPELTAQGWHAEQEVYRGSITGYTITPKQGSPPQVMPINDWRAAQRQHPRVHP